MEIVFKNLLWVHNNIRSIGYTESMEDYEKRKLGIFNLLNVLGFSIGIFLPAIGLLVAHIQLPFLAWVVTFSPAMVSMLVLILNHFKLHEAGTLAYFILYPILTALVYKVSFDIGGELFFLLYGVLSVFFLKNFIHVIIAFSLTLFCYFYVFVFTKNYSSSMVNVNFHFYVLTHILPCAFIFYALFLIKKENTQYQLNILNKNSELHAVNLEVQKQNMIIDDKARLLEKQNRIIDEKAKLLQKQTMELTELNTMKNKLFSVISHDLKAPLYALRNLFRGVQQYDIPPDEIKKFIPEVVKDLNYTTALMENLLIWVKSQMHINIMHPQMLEVNQLVKESTDLLRLQAHTKQINIYSSINNPVYIYADKDMINLVIRNLLSNGIKFTPEKGEIEIGLVQKEEMVEIFVRDTGVGMESNIVNKLFDNNFFTTKGTANETGTGLGLMLCKDFLSKNGGTIHVSSKPGVGSTFSFSLPRKMK